MGKLHLKRNPTPEERFARELAALRARLQGPCTWEVVLEHLALASMMDLYAAHMGMPATYHQSLMESLRKAGTR